jgi:hypothetical protein
LTTIPYGAHKDSPISVLAKMAAKQGVKVAIKRFAEQQIEHRFKNYMSK